MRPLTTSPVFVHLLAGVHEAQDVSRGRAGMHMSKKLYACRRYVGCIQQTDSPLRAGLAGVDQAWSHRGALACMIASSATSCGVYAFSRTQLASGAAVSP